MTDAKINEISLAEERIVISKDADFVNSYLLQGRPFKLLLIATGNIRNAELLPHFAQHLPTMATLFAEASFVELNSSGLVVHA